LIKAEADTCIAKLPDALMSLTPDGTVDKIIKSLSANTSMASLDEKAKLSDDENEHFNRLDKIITDRVRKSPAKLASEYRQKAGRLRSLLAELDGLAKILGSDAITALGRLQDEALDAQKEA